MKFKSIHLKSSNLSKQRAFYTNKLGFELVEDQERFFAISIGETTVYFEYQKDAVPYHFACNIPSNKGAEALNWLQERVETLDFEGQDLVDFKAWNAEAMYFYDEDHNIVEFIARKNLKLESSEKFTIHQVQEVSEMGVPTANVAAFFEAIQAIFPIGIYSGTLDKFCAAGDEHGLFIVIDNTQKKWIPRNDEAFFAPFKTVVGFDGVEYDLDIEKGNLTKGQKI